MARKLVTMNWLKKFASQALVKWFVKEYGRAGRPDLVQVIRKMRDNELSGLRCPSDSVFDWTFWSGNLLDNALMPDAQANWQDAELKCADTRELWALDVEYARRHMRRKSA